MVDADVSICIPAWQAEEFIARTLACARQQTHAAIRILVSVDLCDDATAAICRKHARQDQRIEVVVQKERLGWSENANSLLDRVSTEFYFLYFHDDIIEPTYTAQLVEVLRERPDATSAHCDLKEFGKQQTIRPGYAYEGSDTQRLLNFLVGPIKGTTLRSLTRSDVLNRGLRFPNIAENGFWRCHPFHMHLLAAGPALHVPQVLYRRWQRDGSMTRTWGVKSVEALIDGQRESGRICLDIIEDAHASPVEKEILRFSLYIMMMTWTRRSEIGLDTPELVEPSAVSPAFADIRLPETLSTLNLESRDWVFQAYGELLFLEGQHARRRGDKQAATSKLAAAVALHPSLTSAREALALLSPHAHHEELAMAHAAKLLGPSWVRLQNHAGRCSVPNRAIAGRLSEGTTP
jgi:hypothetical protein